MAAVAASVLVLAESSPSAAVLLVMVATVCVRRWRRR